MDNVSKLSLCIDESLKSGIEINNNDSIFKLIFDLTDINKILNEKNSGIFEIFYLCRKIIHNILYNYDEILEINLNLFENKLSQFFYFELLIQANLIDYKYSFDIINNLYYRSQYESNPNIKIFIISKITLELINNYESFTEDNKYSYDIKDFFNNILEKNKKDDILKEINLNSSKIDQIYIDIINILIRTNKFSNSDYCYNIIDQLDLKNINITKTMFDELIKVLNDKNITKIYLISNKEDLKKEEIICFYDILFNYILKRPFYIYHFPFLLKTRKTILKLIKSKELSFDNFKNINNKSKIEKIIEFIADSKFYFSSFDKNYISISKSLFSEMEDLSKNKQSDSKVVEYTGDDYTPNLNKKNMLDMSMKLCDNEIFNSEKFKQNANTENDIKHFLINDYLNESKFEIIKFIKIIYLNKNNKKEENKKNEYKIRTIEFIKNIRNSQNNFYLSGGINSKLMYYDSFLKPINEIEMEYPHKYNYFVGEYNDNKVAFFSENIKYLITIKLDKPSYYQNDLESQDYTISPLYIEEIKSTNFSIMSSQSKILFCGKEGIFLVEDLDSKIIRTKVSKLSEEPTTIGIKLDKMGRNLAFLSYDIINTKNNKLFFFSQNIKEKLKKNEINSFSMTLNSLCLMKIITKKVKGIKYKGESIKFLLCACKKFCKFQKNGIFILKLPKHNDFINVNEKNLKIKEYFYDTGNFEVYCFCQILKVVNNNPITNDFQDANYNEKINIEYTKFFFVGGYDTLKGRGKIQLFKIIFNEEKDEEFKIEFIQDIIINNLENNIMNNLDIYHIFKNFGGPISSIIQSKITGNIVVTCFDGNVYLFTPPNIIDYEVEDLTFKNFFSCINN